MKKWVISFFVLVLLIGLVSAESNGTETINETQTTGCAERISITFTQDVYYEGDYAKFTVEIFNPQGNKISNYPFYLSIYEYATDHWDYNPSPEMTNNEGYFEFGKVVGDGDSKGKILYKVHTEETSSCSKVEDSTETEFRAKETEEATEGTESTVAQPETCAARITIDFDKEVYYIGDEFKGVIEIFDSQGNHIPYYDLYFQSYTYEPEGMWHTPEIGRTDGDGYKIYQGIIERDKMIFGRTKLKAYTKEYNDCGSVEASVLVEVRREEEQAQEPIPCGIGTCIPEEEAGEVEAIPEERVFYKCDGCELEGKCYPMGYRKEGRYCSDNYEFVSQIEGACDNSFECKSNVCISGECIEEGLIKRIIKWFKKLFGGEDEDEKPGLKMCSKLLIEKNIKDYEYFISEYGKREEQQVAVYSEDGEQIDIAKCCMAGYLEDGEAKGTAGVVCPFDNRKDVENSIHWLSNEEEIILGEYKGQEVYVVGNSIIWIHKDFIVAVGTDPKATVPHPEDIADAYLRKYPNDLGKILG